MSSETITEIINTVYDGVSKSKTGEIVTVNPDGANIVNNVSFNTFLRVLESLIPKNFTAEMREPPESWRKEQ